MNGKIKWKKCHTDCRIHIKFEKKILYNGENILEHVNNEFVDGFYMGAKITLLSGGMSMNQNCDFMSGKG